MKENGALFKKSPRALSRVVGDEVLIAVPQDRQVLSLSSTGRAIWELLDSPITIPELVLRLARLYECQEDSIAPDVNAFLNQLLERRAVERHA